MASSSFVLLPLATAAATSACPPLNSTGRLSSTTRRRGRRLACRSATASGGGSGDDDDHQLVQRRIDRRDVLLGLTGVAATSSSNLGVALAAAAPSRPRPPDCVSVPITAEVLRCFPDEETDANVDPNKRFKCGASATYDSEAVIDFSQLLKEKSGEVRRRRAAHLLDDECIKKYKHAIERMKALHDDDPCSFKNQAAIHQAYCDKHYKVVAADGSSNEFDVHFSSIFAPWHRMYIYFFERILGDLIDDPKFGLPYWNWDAPEGMTLPAIFAEPLSPLYDENRDPDLETRIIDLNGGGTQTEETKPRCNNPPDCIIENNLCTLHRQMFVDTALEFHGKRFCKVIKNDRNLRDTYIGSLENGAHGTAHRWVGSKKKRGIDMGVLGMAARDPVFYANHSNVDRMWHLWVKKLNHEDLPYQQWRDTSFVFYDEKRRPVRIKVSDVLDIGNLGYEYKDQPLLWEDCRPTPCPELDRGALKTNFQPRTLITTQGGTKRSTTTAEPSTPPAVVSFPVTLKKGKNEYVTVTRPEKARADGGSSKKAPEVLVIDLTFDPCEYSKFDVLVNVPIGQEEKVEARHSEFAGSFQNVPHGKRPGVMEMQAASYTFPLRQLVQDLKCGRDKQLDITLVPVDCDSKVIINDVSVELL